MSLISVNRKSIFHAISISALTLTMSGCLDTRQAQKEQEEKQVIRTTVASLQQRTADVNARFQDIEDEIRKLGGRMEAVEARLNQSQSSTQKGSQAIEGKLKENDSVYREEFTKLHKEIEDLKAQLAGMRDDQARSAAAASAAASAAAAQASKNPFAAAEDNFEKKNWKEAILDYEKFRKANPNGKQFPTATYKIGVSFQELGMLDEARSFYEEVIAKFPKSKDAEKASKRLKALKKK